MAIAVFGSINIDFTAYGDKLPRLGETVKGRHYTIGLGGKAANQAVAAARLGSEVSLIGRVGTDEFSDIALRALEEHGVSTNLVFQDSGSKTGLALIEVDALGENAIMVVAGANLNVSQNDITRGASALRSAKILLSQFETPPDISFAASVLARQSGAVVIQDPAPAPYYDLNRETLSQIDILTPNARETQELVGVQPETTEEARGAAHLLRNLGAVTVIIKLGKAGVYASGPEIELFVPPFKVATIDSVGAGDCFNAGLAYALEMGKPLAYAVRFAAACGALATTSLGAAAAAPRKADVEALLASQPKPDAGD
jgi:ribokinase